MAGAGEVLEKARTLFEDMGERTQTLERERGGAIQDYQRLREQMQRTQATEKRLEDTAAGVDARLSSIVGHFFWSRVFAAFLGGLVAGGMILYFFPRW